MNTATLQALPSTQDAAIDTPEYRREAGSGATKHLLERNLLESNFHQLRSLQPYMQAGQDGRERFVRDLTEGKLIASTPFPFEVALLRALHMGLSRWEPPQHSFQERVASFVGRLRCAVMAEHLSGALEYAPEVFFRPFWGVDVHRDVPVVEDAAYNSVAMDWLDFRIHHIPGLEMDLMWDLFQMNSNPFAQRKGLHPGYLNLGRASRADESMPRVPIPVLVSRQRNRVDRPKPGDLVGRSLLPLSSPGASLHLSLVQGSVAEVISLFPKLVGAPPDELDGSLAKPIDRDSLDDSDLWLIVGYTLAPPVKGVVGGISVEEMTRQLLDDGGKG